MQFEVDIIKALQTLQNGFLTGLNQVFSFFGTETFFMIVALVVYWCVDKKFGHRFFNVYILGVAVTNVMKLGFKRTRPFDAYPDTVQSLQEKETSFSFPSGHTETISSVSALLTIKYGKRYKIIPIIGAILIILVMLSRMYLGQHYLSDVFCGLTVGVFSAIAFSALMSLFKDKEEWFLVPAVVITAAVIGVLAGLGKLADSPDMLKGLGAFVAFDIGYFIEKHFVRYDVSRNRKWWAIVIKLIVGGGITVAIQQGFKLFLPESIPMLYCFVRYLIMAGWAAVAAPAIFKACKI